MKSSMVARLSIWIVLVVVLLKWNECDCFTFQVARPHQRQHPLALMPKKHRQNEVHHVEIRNDNKAKDLLQKSMHVMATVSLGLCLAFASSSVGAAETESYDGFANYAKENQMQQSDVSCFINKCGDQTKALFANPRGIKGVSCLGRCKGEQTCAMRCFAEFGSKDLDNWLGCTIEDYECVKVPKANLDNSAENLGYDSAIKNFDPNSLVGKWYKTDGLNPNYDLFDCQSNTFTMTKQQGDSGTSELDMGIAYRISRPNGGFWDNFITEHMVADGKNNEPAAATTTSSPSTMHTEGKMNGLTFYENWYILGESDGSEGIPPFKLVAYKGHTLQGNYEGSFVYAKEPILPEAAIPAVRQAASKAGLNFDDYTRIDNTCPAGSALNDDTAGTGTSTTDWINLVIGEGGVIDWIVPGWRGEYKK